ncbi:ornithine carbamoyltransferase, partial [Streptomyces sp. NPDC001193]
MHDELHRRPFVKELDFTPEEFRHLLELSASIKTARREGREEQRLRGKNIAVIFEKTSTRTRCACSGQARPRTAAVVGGERITTS